jgi:hypothetical protein
MSNILVQHILKSAAPVMPLSLQSRVEISSLSNWLYSRDSN